MTRMYRWWIGKVPLFCGASLILMLLWLMTFTVQADGNGHLDCNKISDAGKGDFSVLIRRAENGDLDMLKTIFYPDHFFVRQSIGPMTKAIKVNQRKWSFPENSDYFFAEEHGQVIAYAYPEPYLPGCHGLGE